MLRTVTATEYVTPLREGGWLPAIVGADDDGTYVVKWRGAGQGGRGVAVEGVSAAVGAGRGAPRGGGDLRRDRAQRGAAGAGDRARAARRADGAHGARSGDPGAAAEERRAERRARLPAGIDRFRSSRRPRVARKGAAGLGHRLVRHTGRTTPTPL